MGFIALSPVIVPFCISDRHISKNRVTFLCMALLVVMITTGVLNYIFLGVDPNHIDLWYVVMLLAISQTVILMCGCIFYCRVLVLLGRNFQKLGNNRRTQVTYHNIVG